MYRILTRPNRANHKARGEKRKAKARQLFGAHSPLMLAFAISMFFVSMISSARAQDQGASGFWLSKIPLTGCQKLASDKTTCADPLVLTQPAAISWDNLVERLPIQGRIPPALPDDLRYQTGLVPKKEVVTVDLSAEVPKWLSLDFRNPRYGATEQWVQSAGNILEAFSALRKNEAAQKEAMQRLRSQYAPIWEEIKDFLPGWIQDTFLYSPKWNPYERGSPETADNDGILDRPPFLLRAGLQREGFVSPPKDRKIYQACAPIYAPLETIFMVENGFRDYPRQVGSNYQEVYPLKDAYFTGKDPGGNPFVLFDVAFKQKPFSPVTLRFVLRQFIHFEAGRWVMENQLVEGDMNYLRLKIFYDPIITTEGRVIGYVKTELMDIDIRNIPDGDKDRIAGVRGDVGNIKLFSEAKTEKGQ